MADVEWKFRGEHMWDGHQIEGVHATEAVNDADAVWFDPDPKSKSGLTIRVIGYSHTLDKILTVIIMPAEWATDLDDTVTAGFIGVNGWTSNSTERRTYREGQ